LLAALLIRAVGLRFGLPQVIEDEDEQCVVQTAVGIFGGDWRLSSFRYPSLFIYAIRVALQPVALWGRLAGEAPDAAHLIARFDADVTPFVLIARVLSLAAGLGTIAVAAAIARRLGGATAGLLTGLALAPNPLHAELSRLGRVDSTLVLWLTAGLYFTIRYFQEGRARDLAFMSLSGGLALATKYSAPLFLPVSVAVAFLRGPTDRHPLVASRLSRVLIAAAVPVAVFFLLNPQALLNPGALLAWVLHQSDRVGTSVGSTKPPGAVYYSGLLLSGSFGAGLLVVSLVGLLALARRDRAMCACLLLFVLPYSIVIGTSRPTFDRYLLPILPVLAIGAGLGAVALAKRFSRTPGLVFALALIPTLPFLASRLVIDVSGGDTRLRAVKWVEDNVRPGSTVFLIQPVNAALPLGDLGARSLSRRFWLRDHLKTRPEVRRRAVQVADSLRASSAKPLYRVVSLGSTPWPEYRDKTLRSVVAWSGWRAERAPSHLGETHAPPVVFRRGWACQGPYVLIYPPKP
jgi:hypothetical protein